MQLGITISVIGVLIAGMSAFLTYGQLRAAVNQQMVSIDQQVAATRLADLRFVGRVAVELDKAASRIKEAYAKLSLKK
jgi:hypothetical protein